MKLLTKKDILNIVFVVSLIIANVVSSRTISTGFHLAGAEVIIPGAAFCYAITFLATDVIGELYGKKEAHKTVMLGFVGQLLATALIIFTSFLPASDKQMNNAFNMLLSQNYIFVIGSMAAYLLSQTWDVVVFHRVRDCFKNKYKGESHKMRWVWNNASTMTSQIIDTVVFIVIVFGIGFGWLFKADMHQTLLNMLIGQYIVKFLLAALDTPFFYILTRKR